MPKKKKIKIEQPRLANPEVERRFGEAEGAAWLILGGIFAGTAVLQGQSFISMWELPSGAGSVLPYSARIILFVQLIAISILWMAGTHSELELWEKWLDTRMHEPGDFEVYLAIFGLPVVLGLMFLFVYNIVLISLYISLYLVFNIWAQWVANTRFDGFLKDTRTRYLSKAHEQVLVVMEQYWLKRPQLGRISCMALFSLASFFLALAGAQRGRPGGERLQLLAYGVLILTLLVGDGVVNYWRVKRQKEIKRISREAGTVES